MVIYFHVQWTFKHANENGVDGCVPWCLLAGESVGAKNNCIQEKVVRGRNMIGIEEQRCVAC